LRFPLAFFLGLALLSSTRSAIAQSCTTLQYSFQPDCYRPDESSACVQSVSHMDLGPQIAVWLQDASGAFVDTLMVTNATSVRGIGNRPGRSDFLSGPLFPYGKRVMALPIWAHARGKTYSTVVMQEGPCPISPGESAESCLGWHESFSSTEGYFCRPLQQAEAQVSLGTQVNDAITCASVFHSEKGKFDGTMPSYYPPRSDLTTFTSVDGIDPPTYAAINDLDAVAAATPFYGSVYNGTWSVPGTLPPGDYGLMVEVNKEYDSNGSHLHPDFDDSHLPGYGTDGNFGQPSVVYQVPIHIDPTSPTTDAESTSQIAGYGDWTGETGVINPRDGTISTNSPGSGEARLLVISDSTSGLSGRVLARLENSTSSTTQPPSPVADLTVPPDGLTAVSATLQFTRLESNGGPVPQYEVRYQTGAMITEEQFGSAAVAPQVQPGSPGTLASVTIGPLKPGTQYAVAVRTVEACEPASPIATVTFTTPSMKFTQLTGCFVATAAWGSALAPDVDAMRKVRDGLRPRSTIFAVATDLYYRSGPAAAEVLRRSDTARALVRRFLGPIGAASKAAVALASGRPTRP
jgi:fibronectin type III domain protein